ncbi:hypothetical protein H310_01936 [Aphanomyces invadans]|uniref:B30.2/SPRY domain-containing protein n=1 Tax=Aphanomyces invadans TaxID=157072 RepID=A0A024UP94_9STRA|nr:hypothetical protein H310_01936 [Aphanomyces invadans]ETW07413.1 hypothetical protein H310_01936 [Aphanomyces invadans]|eukprot:XP_008863506.1 hypothetical protein H310_01936 [Aphanomyces invadans]
MELVHGDIFRQIAGHLGTRDLKCISITCRIFSDMVHHDDSTLWKDQFYRRWNSVNFKLDRSVPCIVSEMVRQEFNSDSACFRFLTHLVHRVPMFADVNYTHVTAGLVPQHRFRVLEYATGHSDAPLTIAYDGNAAGADRCVRANAPFWTDLHVTVHRRRGGPGSDYYAVGITRHGYFEVSIRPCPPSSTDQPRSNVFHAQQGILPELNCVAIGVADQDFNVIRNQPGWRGMSFGYHSDDGHAFHRSSHGQPYGPTFGCGDTVGCLLLDHSSIVYTLNGQAAGPPIPCRPTSPLFPVVGVDTSDAIEWNFGQNPFVFDVSPQWEAQDTNIDVLWAACRTATYLSDDSSDEDESWMHNAAMDGYNLTNDSDDSDPFIESMDELDWSLDSAVDSDDSDGEEM